MEVEAWLARAAAARPEHIALMTLGGGWSYARLHEAARFGAGQLRARGAGAKYDVAILAHFDKCNGSNCKIRTLPRSK